MQKQGAESSVGMHELQMSSVVSIKEDTNAAVITEALPDLVACVLQACEAALSTQGRTVSSGGPSFCREGHLPRNLF
jgi:hypothetical protein